VNFKIFPATISRDGRKIPLIDNWEKLATTDKTQIQKWSEQFKDRIKMWGIPCAPNGILALDVDVKDGDGFETLKEFGEPETLSQTTISGGKHFVFNYPKDGYEYGNTVKFLPNLDSRGRGGWIAHYGKFDNRPILDAPEWFINHLKRRKERKQADTYSTYKMEQPIADSIFTNALDLVRNAPPGEANNTLNAQAYVIGQLVAQGNFKKEYAYDELMQAAKDRGKSDSEARATINSGLTNGISHPPSCPFSPEPPKLIIEASSKISDVPFSLEESKDWTPKHLTLFDLTNRNNLKKPQLFKDWSTEDIHLTTADGGTGKTTLKLYEAVCLALGERFLGFVPEQRGKTLFITGEDSDDKLKAMLGQIVEQMGLFEVSESNSKKLNTILSSITIKKDDNLPLMIKNNQGMLEINEHSYNKVIKGVHDLNPKMIVFDPIAAFWGPESMVNDMTKVVAKFMSRLVHDTKACVEMINHMGKSSSNSKDMTQFAGRGGTALPSHSRVSRVLRGVSSDEYKELTGQDLQKGESSLLCNVNKFSDGSPLLDNPFLILRKGFLFTKVDINKALVNDDDPANDDEKVFNFIQSERRANRYPMKGVIENQFTRGNIMTKTRVSQAIKSLQYSGFKGIKIREIDNPDETIKDKAYILINEDGSEV